MFVITLPAEARHGKGGTLTYEFLGNGSRPNTSAYRVTATHYIDCDGVQFVEASIFLGLFDAVTNKLIITYTIPKSSQETIRKSYFGCINPAPNVCFVQTTYVQTIEVDNNANGYILAEQECCRIQGIVNLVNSNSVGGTNFNAIPGIINGVDYHENSSPVFTPKDTAVICHNAPFELDFSANDKDGDSLVYAFCAAKSGGTAAQRQPNPPDAPPYPDIIYRSGFSGSQPLGPGVSINPTTGIISGTAPAATGKYIVSVCAYEYRNGVLIGTTKKEVQVEIADCSLSAALLKPQYINCDSYDVGFENEALSADVNSWNWDFGVPSTNTDVSTNPQPLFTYPDTGVYVVKLRVATANGCTDSTEANVLVYPGFKPQFSVAGSCYLNPFRFSDLSTTQHGSVNSWRWNIGPDSVSNNPEVTHQFSDTGQYTVSLYVGTTKGCRDTLQQVVAVTARPDLKLAFRDTLICGIDTLQLQALGRGQFSWTPTGSMIDANTATPKVFPTDTSTYIVTLNENGCIASDTVQVAVLPFITVQLPADTTICAGDSIQLRPQSQALQYKWTPAASLNTADLKFPMAAPGITTTYELTASLGQCMEKASMTVKVVPYPKAAAGADTLICYGTAAQLRGNVSGASFNWSPAATLQNGATLSPLAKPLSTTAYVLTVLDDKGCPKEVSDTVLVQVVPRIEADAGRDTVVVAGQPLQLQATGGEIYSWFPPISLNDPLLPNPIAILDGTQEKVTYYATIVRDGCLAVDSIHVIVYKTGADILVPNAFTPNGDGRNDVFRPHLVGMKSLESFQVFNRWGELIYTTRTLGQGWDGRLHGAPQASGTYVFLAAGTTYDNRKIVRKGTLVLVR